MIATVSMSHDFCVLNLFQTGAPQWELSPAHWIEYWFFYYYFIAPRVITGAHCWHWIHGSKCSNFLFLPFSSWIGNREIERGKWRGYEGKREEKKDTSDLLHWLWCFPYTSGGEQVLEPASLCMKIHELNTIQPPEHISSIHFRRTDIQLISCVLGFGWKPSLQYAVITFLIYYLSVPLTIYEVDIAILVF